MYTTILHQLFPRVELETFKSSGTASTQHIWGEPTATDLDVHPDNLMDHVLQQRHSFAFPRAEGIRLIRVWNQDGAFISTYDEFLDAIGISIEQDAAIEPCTDNPYLSSLRTPTSVEASVWTKLTLLKMYQDMRGISIGSGANKEMVEVSTYGTLLPKYDIELESLIDATAKDITKASKYLGRLLRPFRYYTMKAPSILVHDCEVDAFMDGWTASVDVRYCTDVLNVPDAKVGDRLEITALNVQGLLKGHGVVGDHPETNVLLYGDQYKRIVRSSGLKWFAVDVLHGSKEAYLDIQTLVNLGRVFPERTLQNWITTTVANAIHNTKYAKLPSILTDVRTLLREPSRMFTDRWSLRRMSVHGLQATLPVMLRKTYTFHRSSIRKLNKLRIRIPGAIRRYVAPDLNDDVRPGNITIKGASFLIAREDAPWYMQLHGGADNDDSFVLIPLTKKRVLMYRNPNQLGEWSVMHVQESDVHFDDINNLQLPNAQRLNWKRDGLTADQIMKTVASFWDHIAAESVEVDKALIPRIPERIRDRVKPTNGPITRLFQFADENLSLADEAISLYSEEMNIPEDLITSPRSPYYELARELRHMYGHGIRTARGLNEKYSRAPHVSEDEVEADLQKRIEKIHGRVRGTLNQLDPDVQKMVLYDLMRICYLELPGTSTGDSGYTLTQANDGVLGIPSSPNGRLRGTFDVLIDVLVDSGLGRRPILDEDKIVFDTVRTPIEYETEGIAVRVIGGWQNVGSLYKDEIQTEDHLISLAYRAVKDAVYVQVSSRSLYINDTLFGSIVSKAHVSDGAYKVLYPGRPGKSQVLHIAECEA